MWYNHILEEHVHMLEPSNIAEIRLYFEHLLIMGLELRKIDS